MSDPSFTTKKGEGFSEAKWVPLSIREAGDRKALQAWLDGATYEEARGLINHEYRMMYVSTGLLALVIVILLLIWAL